MHIGFIMQTTPTNLDTLWRELDLARHEYARARIYRLAMPESTDDHVYALALEAERAIGLIVNHYTYAVVALTR